MTGPEAAVRDVTDEEIRRYRSDGWVKLPRILSRDVAAALLTRAKAVMGENGDAHSLRPGRDIVGPHARWHDYHGIAEEDELFGSVAFSLAMGRNAQRLIGRDIPVQVFGTALAVKLGSQQVTSSNGRGSTRYHQDMPALPMDRVGALSIWIALDEITPDMGTMRFHTGSHRLGSLGRFPTTDLKSTYPDLDAEHALSAPIRYEPGDATVHNALMVHGAPENSTDRPRWSLISIYFPGDALYTGAPVSEHYTSHVLGLTVDRPFPAEVFPLAHR
jgi:hypothetical protein